jgi:pimeloyl-ACP methyl ester carboxylesterase
MKNYLPCCSLFLLALTAVAMPAHTGDAVADSNRHTYVIVHGAWGGGWAFKQVEQHLHANGHTVYRPTLTGQGEKVHLATPEINLSTHITDIVNVILWEDLHDIVLVGHSYGGAVITGVVDRLPDRIKHVIYLDAAILNDGESVVEANGRGLPGDVVDGGIIPSWVTPDQPIPHDVPHPVKTLTEPLKLTNQNTAQQIPTSYVLFVEPDSPIEEARFYSFYLRAKARGWTLRTLTSDHNAQWSHPMELAAVLEDATKD